MADSNGQTASQTAYNRQPDGQTDRQTDRKAGGKIDRPTDRGAETDRRNDKNSRRRDGPNNEVDSSRDTNEQGRQHQQRSNNTAWTQASKSMYAIISRTATAKTLEAGKTIIA